MIYAIDDEVPKPNDPSAGVSIREDAVRVYLLVSDDLIQLATLELHLLFEAIVFVESRLSPVDVLPHLVLLGLSAVVSFVCFLDAALDISLVVQVDVLVQPLLGLVNILALGAIPLF